MVGCWEGSRKDPKKRPKKGHFGVPPGSGGPPENMDFSIKSIETLDLSGVPDPGGYPQKDPFWGPFWDPLFKYINPYLGDIPP